MAATKATVTAVPSTIWRRCLEASKLRRVSNDESFYPSVVFRYAELGRRRQSAATIEKEAHDDVEAMFTEPTVGPRRTTCVQQTITPALRLLSKCSNVFGQVYGDICIGMGVEMRNSIFGQAQSRAQCPEPCLKVLKHLAISCSYVSQWLVCCVAGHPNANADVSCDVRMADS